MGLLDALFNSDSFGGQGGGLLDLLKTTQMQNSQYQPGPGFAPQQPQTPGRSFDSSMFDPSTYAPNQAQPVAVGNNYQMPRLGDASQFTPNPAAIPPAAQAAQGQMPQGQSTDMSAQSRPPDQQLPPAFGQQSSGMGSNALTGLQSFLNGGGLISSIRGAMNGQRTDPQGMAQQNLKAQFDNLQQVFKQNGMSDQEASSKALLAVQNPKASETAVAEQLSNKEKWGEVGTDALGNKQMGFINERDQTVNGKPMAADGSTASGAAGGFLAPGVKQIDSSLTGKDYLGQFSPEVQAAVQNYVDGKSMPTGNPRKGFTQTVKMIAQKYGADTGQSVDDATYMARRTMRNQLSSSAPSSLGGQINIGNTAAGHLADLTQKALELGNYDTGIAPLTSIVNNARGLGTEQAAKMEALKGAAQHYGQEITKFYAGSPGGVAERDRFIESVNGARSPKELAAILSTEGELMRSRLDALGGQIKGVLGDEGSKQYPVLRPDGQAALSKVEENVSRLKGGQAAASGNKPATVAQNGHTYSLQPDGSYK